MSRRTKAIRPRATDQGTPDFWKREPLPLAQYVPTPAMLGQFPQGTPMRAYKLGECLVVDTIRPDGRRHLSISHAERYPTWDEIAEARYRVLGDRFLMALLLPATKDYVNLHPNCFQLVEIRDTLWTTLD